MLAIQLAQVTVTENPPNRTKSANLVCLPPFLKGGGNIALLKRWKLGGFSIVAGHGLVIRHDTWVFVALVPDLGWIQLTR